jgi:HEAT repeat protein
VSSEAKIGLAVAVVALVAIIWFAAGGGGDENSASLVGAKTNWAKTGAKIDVAAERFAGDKAARVKEYLAQLKSERGEAKDGDSQGAKLDPKSGAAFAKPQRRQAQPEETPIQQETNDADLDFDTLRDLALVDKDPDNRVSAIWLLASLDDEEPVLPVLTQALSDEDPDVRMAAIQALSEFSEETPLESLQIALQDSDAEIRFEALSIVAEMDDDRAQPFIQQALDDPDEDVRSLAEGLADMQDTYEPAPTAGAAPAPTAAPAQ